MSPSTVESSADGRVLLLRFEYDGRELAVLEVAVDAPRDPSLPAIRETADPEDPDADTPILICRSPELPGPRVLLLEETSYELKLVPADGVAVEDELSDLRRNGDDAVLRESGLSSERLFKLRFNSFVGKGVFDAILDGKHVEIPFEVRSRKMGYYREYPRMLADIAEFSTALLLSARSPLYSHYAVSAESTESKYEEFLVLEYIFDALGFEEAYEEVRRNRHRELVDGTETVPACLAHSIGPSSLASIARGRNLVKVEDGPVLGMYAPVTVDEPRAFDSYDTPENRLVKEVVLAVQACAGKLRRDLGGECSDYVRDRLEEMCRKADGFASDEWLSDVGEMRAVPYGSQVLARRRGYAEVFSAYHVLGAGALFDQEDARSLLKGRGNKVHLVYEYWCYTRLYLRLKARSARFQELPVVKDRGGWSVSVRGGDPVSFEIPCKDDVLDVRLYYNRTFENDGSDMSSYSVRLRPDFTLLATPRSKPGRASLVHFDAKYKAKWKESGRTEFDESRLERGCWEYDVYKMHTYRDALLRSTGSYVLYPGDVPEIYPKPVEGRGGILPSVGAIRLVPGRGTEDLDKALERIFEDVVGTMGETCIERPIGNR